jgi:predicted nucleic acid-binding protein
MLVIDTNVLIAYFDGDSNIVQWLEEASSKTVIVISTITVVELLCYPGLSEAVEAAINQWLSTCIVADVDTAIAREAAVLKRQHYLSITDAVIAATAKLYRASVVTRDKDFSKLNNVEVLRP